MPRYKLADGTLMDVPEDLTPEESAWLKEQKAQPVSTLKDVGKSALSGVTEGALRAPFIFGDLLSLGARGVNKLAPGTFDPKYEKLVSDRAVEIGEDASGLRRHQPETDAGRYANAGGAGLGGALAFGPVGAFRSAPTGIAQPGAGGAVKDAIAKLLTKQAVTAPVVGMAAQGGNDLAGPAGGLTAGLTTQALATLLSRGMTPNHPAWLRKGTEAMGPDDWSEAFKNRQRLQDSGSTSYTLTDALPETAQARGMTRDISNTSGASVLTDKLAGRNSPGTQELVNGQLVAQNRGDIPTLLDDASAALNPTAPNIGAVTEQVAGLADDALGAAREARSAQYLPLLQQGPQVPKQDLVKMLLAIKAKAGGPGNLGTMDQTAMEAALKAINKTPLHPMPVQNVPPGAVQTVPPVGPPNYGANLEALSKNVKGLKQGVPTPDMGLNKAAGYGAYKLADEALKGVSPNYSQAMQVYGDATDQLVNPLKQGLVGQLAGLKGQPPSINSLPGVINRSPVEESRKALDSLVQDPSLRGQIARIVADANKRPMTSAGPTADATARARQTAVDLVDPQAAATYSLKTGAADTLSRLTAEAGADATAMQGLSQSGVAAVAAPFLELRNRMRLRMSEKETKVLAGLLANPTEENLKVWQKIATERPDLQPGMSAMRRLASVQGGVTAEGEN
jgi:hypothetical protein